MAKKKVKKTTRKPARKSTAKAARKPARKTTGKKKPAAKKPGKKKSAGKPAKKTVKKPAPKKSVKKTTVPVKRSTTVNVYLNFKGNCEEAFNFYRSVFGGKFGHVGRFKEMPPMPDQPLSPEMAEKIMHISLPVSAETILMGSDTVEGHGAPFVAGNNFSISVNPRDKKEADRIFQALANGGTTVFPMADMFWGAYFGMLIDKFGIHWMVNLVSGKPM